MSEPVCGRCLYQQQIGNAQYCSKHMDEFLALSNKTSKPDQDTQVGQDRFLHANQPQRIDVSQVGTVEEILRKHIGIGYSGKPPHNQNSLKKVKGIEEAVAAITQWHLEEVQRIEKAYGGCHNCYGKGYATAESWATTKGKKWRTGGPMHFCDCDRGKQLKQLTTHKENV